MPGEDLEPVIECALRLIMPSVAKLGIAALGGQQDRKQVPPPIHNGRVIDDHDAMASFRAPTTTYPGSVLTCLTYLLKSVMMQIAHLGEMLDVPRFWDDVQTLATIGALEPKGIRRLP